MSETEKNAVQPTPQPTPQPAPQNNAGQTTTAQPAAQKPVAQQPAAQQKPAAQPTAQPAVQQPKTQPVAKATPPKNPPVSTGKGGNPPKKDGKKRKTDWGGRIITAVVSLIMGFVLGIGAVYGTVAAVIYSIGTQPVDESVQLIDTLTGLELYNTIFGEVDPETGELTKGGILAKKYEDLKIKDLVTDVTNAISGLATEGTTIGDIAEISPFVSDSIDKILTSIDKYCIPIDKNDLLSASIMGETEDKPALVDYLVGTFMRTPAGDLINAFLQENDTQVDPSLAPIIKAFCYGQEGIDYVTEEDGSITMLGGKSKLTFNDFFGGDMFSLLNNVSIDLLLTVDATNPLMCSLAYGEKFRYTVSGEGDDAYVTMNQREYAWTENNGVYTFEDHGAEIVYSVCKVKNQVAELAIDTGKVDTENNPVYETQFVDMNTGKVWQNAELTEELPYGKVTIGTLRTNALAVVDCIALDDVLTLDPNETSPLNSIVYAEDGSSRTIGDLRANSTNIVNQIKLSDVLGEDNPQLNSIVFKEVVNEQGELVKVSRTIGDLQTDKDLVNNIKIAEILSATEYEDGNPLHAIIFKDNEYGNKVSITIKDLAAKNEDGTTFIDHIKVADILSIKYGDGSPLESILFKEDPVTNEMRALTLHELGQDKDLINDIKLAEVLTLDNTTHKALLSIIFDGEYTYNAQTGKYEGVSRTLGQLTTDGNIIDAIKLADVIATDANTHPALLSIIYENGDTNKPRTLKDLSEDSSEIINTIKLADVITTDANTNKVLLSIIYENGDTSKPRTLKDLSENSDDIINGIKLADVITTDDSLLLSFLYKNGDTSNPRTLADFSGTGSEEIINSIKLADVLTITEDSHKALIFLAYGSDTITDTPRTLGEIRDAGDSLINDIPLSYIVTPNMDDTLITYLLYGFEGVHFTTNAQGKAEMLQRHIAVYNGVVYNEYGEKLNASTYSLSGTRYTENGTVYNLVNGAITSLTTKDGNVATVYYLNDTNGNPVKFTETTLIEFAGSDNAITKLTSRLTARDIFGSDIDSNAMLKHLADTPIDQLATAVENLTFGQVFEDQIYRKNAQGQYVDTNGNVVSEENRVLGDIWHYMLTGVDAHGNKYNAAYEYSVVNDMDKLIENMKREVHDATLDLLAHDGILQISPAILDDCIITEINIMGRPFTVANLTQAGIQANSRIGDLTTDQVLIYVENLLATIDQINNFS